MKLKSKLIATIVSICAAIAVMGVGVWAASTQFSVQVSNTVNVAFQNLDGTFSVTGWAGGDNLSEAGTALAEETLDQVLYTAGTTNFNKISSAAEAAGTNKQFTGADFLQTANLTGNTTKAMVAYTFHYAPGTTVAQNASVKVDLTKTTTPVMTGAEVTTTYYIATSETADLPTGAVWYELAETVYIDSSLHFWIYAVCVYENEGTSVKTTTANWVFTIALEAVEFKNSTAVNKIVNTLANTTGTTFSATPGTATPSTSIYTA